MLSGAKVDSLLAERSEGEEGGVHLHGATDTTSCSSVWAALLGVISAVGVGLVWSEGRWTKVPHKSSRVRRVRGCEGERRKSE